MKIKWVLVLILILLLSSSYTFAETEVQRRARLQKELQKLEKEIKEQQAIVDTLSGQRQSLERDIGLLNAKIKKSELAIKQRNYAISKLRSEINLLNSKLGNLDEKLQKEKDSLAQILRKNQQMDDVSMVELLLNRGNINNIFLDVANLSTVKGALSASFKEIEDTKGDITNRKKILEEKKTEEYRLRELQALEKAKVVKAKKEKDYILKTTKGEESKYKQLLEYKKRTAADIRAALFSLRDTKGINFGDAYNYAKYASSKTGVRPALILGIIAQESNLGKNVGTGTWTKDMHPTRDRPIFKKMMAELGFNPDSMPVSKKPWYGWGGAMGPAQFIPSTWILYKDRIAKLSGENPPNPWNPKTAFVATALLMKDNGADAGTRYAERLAALRYFAGWKNAKKPAYSFYGDGVMELADKFQRQIDILEGK